MAVQDGLRHEHRTAVEADYPRFDTTGTPFSRFGSYFAFSTVVIDDKRRVVLRTVRGDRVQSEIFAIDVIESDGVVDYAITASPKRLVLTAKSARVEISFDGTESIRIRAHHAGVRLTPLGNCQYRHAIRAEAGAWIINSFLQRAKLRFQPVAGSLKVDAPAGVLRNERVVVELAPGDEEYCEATLTDILPTGDNDRVRARFVDRDFDNWRRGFEDGASPSPETRDLMAYVLWASAVRPSGHFWRTSILMSKNNMANVWSWDHCFNAMALAAVDRDLAWDQLLIPFDHQDSSGVLPDCLNDKQILWSFSKPPIHGWAIGWMASRGLIPTPANVAALYGKLVAWTDWWLVRQTNSSDGFPHYNHGNDCGWDNCTAFDTGFPVQSPDICAFLALQMETLADIAESIGQSDAASDWRSRSTSLIGRMLERFWRHDRFVTIGGDGTLDARGECLLTYLPLLLGRRLPKEITDPMISRLMEPGRFCTDYGLATESVASNRYQRDGYWRGPVWAPPVLMIVDGLTDLGRIDEASTIARGFCRAVEKSGAAENFDALTGKGYRDLAYTWTASVYLILTREYLRNR